MEDKLDEYLDKVFEQIDDQNLRRFIPYMKEIYDYNVREYKHTRGLFVIEAYRILAPNGREKEAANLLAWMIEVIHTVIMMLDDIMDECETRRGKPCWYKKVGLIAINDGLLLQQQVYEIIRLILQDKPYYTKILEGFNKAFLMRVYGKMMCCKTNIKECQLEDYTSTKLKATIEHKLSYYTTFFPVKLAMIINQSEPKDEKYMDQLEQVLFKIGHLYQMTFDFRDCFGEPFHRGKDLEDIQTGKLCWPIVAAVERSNNTQKEILRDNYGKVDRDCVRAVRKVYQELKLTEVFDNQKADLLKDIEKSIDKLKHDHARICKFILAKIYDKDVSL